MAPRAKEFVVRPLTSSDLAELARYPASLQQAFVALYGVAPRDVARETVPVPHTIRHRNHAAP